MRLNGDVQLPANATARVGQTSLLGSLHVELAPPTGVAPEGRLHEGSLIPLSSGSAYPTTEQTLAAISLLLNGGGVGQIQDITKAFATAFHGRENDLRSLIDQLDVFIRYANDQKDDIISATESLNNLVGQFAAQKPVVDKALKTIPDALAVLEDQRNQLADALAQLGKFSAANIDAVTPWRFAAPLSPDMAAAREHRSIPFDALIAACRAAAGLGDVTLIEGIGGVMVPLDAQHTVLDWITTLGAPTLLVVGSYLGTLSHSLTAAAALRERGVTLAGVVVSESEEQPAPAAETVATLARFVGPIPVRLLPRSAPVPPFGDYQGAPLLPLLDRYLK